MTNLIGIRYEPINSPCTYRRHTAEQLDLSKATPAATRAQSVGYHLRGCYRQLHTRDLLSLYVAVTYYPDLVVRASGGRRTVTERRPYMRP
jgi:hypothetical protein